MRFIGILIKFGPFDHIFTCFYFRSCAYADGTVTAEQMILAAYARGLGKWDHLISAVMSLFDRLLFGDQ